MIKLHCKMPNRKLLTGSARWHCRITLCLGRVFSV